MRDMGSKAHVQTLTSVNSPSDYNKLAAASGWNSGATAIVKNGEK